MFTGVCLSTGGGGSAPGGGCLVRGVCSGGCLVRGGVPGPGRGSAPGGSLVPVGCLVLGVPGGDPPRTATAVGGRHPTGMHSCDLEC